MLEKSIKEFGFLDPIQICQEDMIVAGHARYMVATKLGLEYVPTIYHDMPYEKAVAYCISHNQLARLAEEDKELLGELLPIVSDIQDFDFEATGFSLEDLDTYLGDLTGDSINENTEETKTSLTDRFLVPPFSVLDARQGYWQERKRKWLSLGIKSELGRGGALIHKSETSGNMNFYSQKRKLESELGYKLNTAEAQTKLLELGRILPMV
jgi:hypothetical protein